MPLCVFLQTMQRMQENAVLADSLSLSNDLTTEHVIYFNFNLKFYLAIAESVSFLKK